MVGRHTTQDSRIGKRESRKYSSMDEGHTTQDSRRGKRE